MRIEDFEQMIRLQQALDSVTKVAKKRSMKDSDKQAIIDSLKSLTKKDEKT